MDDLGKSRDLNSADGYLYRFGQFALDSRKRTLSRADSLVSLTPKAFDVLLFLVQNPNRLVTKEELLQAVWGDIFVEEGNLTQYISHLRKALSDNSEDARLIVTIARKGYQFTGNVSVTETAGAASHRSLKKEITKPSRYWWKAVLVGALAAILAGSGYLAWRHFRVTEQPRTEKIMLAVLPFKNLTGDPNKEYLADGLTEEMISQLARLNPNQLGVIARTSVMGYKNKDTRLDQIGRELSVQYVLENSVRVNGNQLRLTAQLIQVKDQTHLWAQDYDYSAKDVLVVQDEVAKAVARQIQLRFTPQQETKLAPAQPVNPEAFDAYLRGYYYFQRNTDEDLATAAKYFESSTQLDPNYALAWAWLSRVRLWQGNLGIIPTDKGRQLAREAVDRALSLNPNLAEAHIQMGRIKQQVDFDWAGADASFRRAVALEPGNPASARMAAGLADELGRFDEALRLNQRAVELDPLNGGNWVSLGETKVLMGQLDQAEVDIKKGVELEPNYWDAPFQLVIIYLLKGRPQDALPEIERIGSDAPRIPMYAIAYHALGREKDSDDMLTKLIAKYHADAAYQIAQVYAFRNQSKEAFEWLDRAYDQRDGGLIFAKVDPLLKNLHGDPRFVAFLKKLNLPA